VATRTGAAIAARFQKILDWAALSARDQEVFNAHRLSVLHALQAGTRLNKVHVMGSVERGTATRGASDIDLLAVVERKEVMWGNSYKSSSTVLGNFRDVLLARFQRTEIGRDGQAVVVNFGDAQHRVDVVPGFYDSQDGYQNHPVFRIPNGSGDWMRTSPSSHNRYLHDADVKTRGHLRGVAMIFKYWRTTRSTPVSISGFHTELLLASRELCVGVQPYSGKFRDLLVELARRECAALNDPAEISGRIAACGTEAKRSQALKTVIEAAYHANQAVLAEAREDFGEAWRQWSSAFNGNFPRDGA
jgi:hypothetical protein